MLILYDTMSRINFGTPMRGIRNKCTFGKKTSVLNRKCETHKVHNLKSETEISQGMALSIEFSHFDSCNTWHFTCDTCLNKELSELEKKWTIRHAQRGKLARAALCTMQEEQCEQEYLLKVFTHFTVKHQTKIHRPSSMAPGFYPLHWNTWF